MDETLALDLVGDFVQVRKNVRRGRAFWPELFFLWQTQRANAGEDFQPRKNEPAQRRDQPEHPTAGDEVNRQIGRDENADRGAFLGKGTLKSAQLETRHSQP